MMNMKVVITVKQHNLQTNEDILLCDQLCDVEVKENTLSFSYKEKAPLSGNVNIKADSKGCTIIRKEAGTTTIKLVEKKKTKGIVESIYGILEMDLYTRRYFKKEEIIAIEYDILNGIEILESYRLMIKMKKVV